MVRLDFSIELDYEVLEPSDFDFILFAARTPQQKVLREHLDVRPSVRVAVETCAALNNRQARLRADPGPLRVHYTALVDIDHHLVAPSELREVAVADLPLEVAHYMRPSRYCPSDCFYGIARDNFGSLAPGYARVQAIADWVRGRTRFQAGTTNSLHCAKDTLQNRVGVCRDFSHLMIAICRALNIPARYATGIDYGSDPALGPLDFHAYVEVYLSGRWYIFDPTGMAMTTGLVRLATGRDANDVSFATIFGSVVWSMPRITMVALADPAVDIALPAPTDLAVSTSGVAKRADTDCPDRRATTG